MKAERLIKKQSILGEGPCWDNRTNNLYWIDCLGRKIYCLHPDSKKVVEYDVSGPIGCIALCGDRELICALQSGIVRFDPESGQTTSLLARFDREKVNNRFNDGKCDPKGRFYVGTMSNSANEGKGSAADGSVFCIDANLNVQTMLTDVTISNGMAWSLDYKTFYYIDSPTRIVAAFDYSLDSGLISNRRIAIDLRLEQGIPDGMTIDTNGNLWIAQWGGWQVSCWDPKSRRKLSVVDLPCKHVSCCTFGGEQLETLFITTARIGLSDEELTLQPDAGSLFTVYPGVSGLLSNRFRYNNHQTSTF
jgi:sugar lactone lactonase YvrE